MQPPYRITEKLQYIILFFLFLGLGPEMPLSFFYSYVGAALCRHNATQGRDNVAPLKILSSQFGPLFHLSLACLVTHVQLLNKYNNANNCCTLDGIVTLSSTPTDNNAKYVFLFTIQSNKILN